MVMRSTGTKTNTVPAGGVTARYGTVTVASLADATAILRVSPPLTVSKSSAAYTDPVNGTTNPKLIPGGFVAYKFVQIGMTYPLLFAVGVSLTPWDKLVAAFTIPNLITIVATVVTLMAVGFWVGRRLGLYPIETAIVNACHSGQGGTGDVAILTAANRMQLMPFAQIATRIGGAIVVTLTLIALSRMS